MPSKNSFLLFFLLGFSIAYSQSPDSSTYDLDGRLYKTFLGGQSTYFDIEGNLREIISVGDSTCCGISKKKIDSVFTVEMKRMGFPDYYYLEGYGNTIRLIFSVLIEPSGQLSNFRIITDDPHIKNSKDLLSKPPLLPTFALTDFCERKKAVEFTFHPVITCLCGPPREKKSLGYRSIDTIPAPASQYP